MEIITRNKRTFDLKCATCQQPIQRLRPSKTAKCRDCNLREKREAAHKLTLPEDARKARKRELLLQNVVRTPQTEILRLEGLRRSDKVKQACRRIAREFKECRIAGVKASPLSGKFETNSHARRWSLRTPNRAHVFEFLNLAHFIRNHSHLFEPEDLVISAKSTASRAELGLAKLSPRRKNPKGSWKGWQWVSRQERIVGNNDLLGGSAPIQKLE